MIQVCCCKASIIRTNTGVKPATFHTCLAVKPVKNSVSTNKDVQKIRYLLSVEIVYELLACNTGVEAHLYVLLDHEASQNEQ